MKNKLKQILKNLYYRNKGKILVIISIALALGVIQIANFTIKTYIAFSKFIDNPVGVKMAYADVRVPSKNTEPSMREYVLEEVRKAGLDVDYVDRLIQCESTWNNWAYNLNTNGTSDLGLLQINSIHKGTISVEDRFNYKTAIKWAIEKRLRDGNWSAWTCSNKI